MNEKQINFLQNMKPGDILVMTSLWRFEVIGRFIRWWTGSDYSHNALYAGSGNLVEAVWTGVRKIHWSNTPYPDYYKIAVMRPVNISVEDRQKAIEYAEKKVGSGYDYFMILFTGIAIMFSWFNINIRGIKNWLDVKSWYYCTELSVDAYYETSKNRIINESINRSQAVPDDFIKNGVGLEYVGSYEP
jgi:uncharacterized protein YycO